MHRWKVSLLFTLSLVFSFSTFAQFLSQRQLNLSCRYLSKIEKSFLQRHVNYKKADKAFEKRFVDKFIDKLDPAKLYLLKSDVSEIKKLFKDIFKKTKMVNCAPIEKAYAIYKKRVVERVSFATKHINDKKFKFVKSTSIFLDPDKRKVPSSLKAANETHKKYIQFQISNYISAEDTLKEAREKLVKSYGRVKRRVEDFDQEDLYSLYLDSFAHTLDPHSSYLSHDTLQDFRISMSLELEGIGATLSSKDGFTTIEQLVAGGAADRSGKLKTKDKILAVAQGEKGEYVNVVEMDLRDVVKKIRGKKGTKVKLKIQRKIAGTRKLLNVVLVRDKVKLEDDAAQISYIDKVENGKKRKIGLIDLPSFYASKGRSAANDLKKLLKEAKKKKVDGVVLDLSSNGGGSLDDAVKIAGLFFKKGNVVKQSHRDPSKSEDILADIDKTVDYNGPLVVLISRVSASASEIVSGTLKDYKRAVIVGGDHTFGKGTVQSVEPLSLGLGAIKTTVGMFFIPGGHSTQHRGVYSDIEFPSIYSNDEIGEKLLDYSLKPKKISSFLSKEAFVDKGQGAWIKLDKNIISLLSQKSKERIKKNKKFSEIKERILKAKKKKDKPLVVGEALKEKEVAKDKEKAECLLEAKVIPDKEERLLTIRECEDPERTLTTAEKKIKYLKRPDIVEAVNIAVDLVGQLEKKKPIKVGKK